MEAQTQSKTPGPPRRGERGQVVVIVALVIVAIVGLLGLVVDGGFLYLARRQAQNAADAAAWAGAYSLADAGHDEAVNSAFYYANLNGFDNDGVHNQVLVHHPPQDGAFVGDPNYIRVTISITNPTYFIHLVYGGVAQVTAAATAGFTRTPRGPEAMVLDPTSCAAFTMQGNATLTIQNGGLMVNSSCQSNAMDVWGNIHLSTSEYVYTNGGYHLQGSVTVEPEPESGIPPAPDPLAGLVAPDTSGMPVRHGTPSNPDTLRVNHGHVTLQPGIYYGGIEITANADVTLEPGIYVIAGGGFEISGNAEVTGNEVCIYNTNDPDHPYGDGDFGSIYFHGNAEIDLTPPQSGDYAGLIVFQDRANSRDMDVNGNAGLDLQTGGGTIYLPWARLDMRGNGHVNAPFIAWQAHFQGDVEMEFEPQFGGGGGGGGTTDVSLVE